MLNEAKLNKMIILRRFFCLQENSHFRVSFALYFTCVMQIGNLRSTGSLLMARKWVIIFCELKVNVHFNRTVENHKKNLCKAL